MIEYPEMITLREAARRTGLSYEAIRTLCLRKQIVFLRVGNRYMVNYGKLCEFLNGEGST